MPVTTNMSTKAIGTVVTYGAITAIDTILDIVAIETYLFLAIATILVSF